nr:hypothetical protein [Tanacetum cinerariifolium]
MEDDMLKAHIKVVDILCDLELIYPPALFDIMIHLVIHLPLAALEGGHIHPRWMFSFERYMKKLKGYNGLRSVIRFDAQELKKVNCYVLHNSPEIDTYRSQFKSLFPNKDMKEEFPDWFGSQIRQRHIDNDKDPEVSTTSELFALACGPTWTPISINSCVVEVVRYVVHSRDERHITQKYGICSLGLDGEMYYGQLQVILEFKCQQMLPGPTAMTVEVRIAPPHHVPSGCMGCFANRGKGKRKPNLGGRAAGMLNTRDKTRNLSLKEITDTKVPVPIQFELRDKQTVMPLGDHAAHWSSYIGEVIRGVPLYYPSWLKVPKERKAALITDIG